MSDKTPHEIYQITNQVVDAFLTLFPNRILAVFSTGSYSGGYAVSGSDLDLVFIFSGSITKVEHSASINLTSQLTLNVPLELDIGLVSDTEKIRPALKYDSTLVYGMDIRDRLQVMDVSYWIRERMHAGAWLVCHLFNRNGIAELPLTPPDIQSQFLGYNTNRGGTFEQPGGTTKDLVRSTSWAATALVARASGNYVTSKKHLLALLDLHLQEPWASFLIELFDFCRTQTHYAIPVALEARLKLRRLCAKTGIFETYFLLQYRIFILEELETCQQRATEALTYILRTPFRDETISNKIAQLKWEDPSFIKLQKKVLTLC